MPCTASTAGSPVGQDPIGALVRGREALRVQRVRDRERRELAQATVFREMLEDTRIETMVSFWRKLPPEKRACLTERLAQETSGADTADERG